MCLLLLQYLILIGGQGLRPWTPLGGLQRPSPEIPGFATVCTPLPNIAGDATVCYLSKYVLARPLKSKTTKEVIENLTDIYIQVGLPDIIQHDQGGEFTSKVIMY